VRVNYKKRESGIRERLKKGTAGINLRGRVKRGKNNNGSKMKRKDLPKREKTEERRTDKMKKMSTFKDHNGGGECLVGKEKLCRKSKKGGERGRKEVNKVLRSTLD